MGMEMSSDLFQFYDFLGVKLSQGDADLSPEEVLDEWRTRHPLPEHLAVSVGDLRQALAEADRGEGVPLAEVFDELRRNIPLPMLPPTNELPRRRGPQGAM